MSRSANRFEGRIVKVTVALPDRGGPPSNEQPKRNRSFVWRSAGTADAELMKHLLRMRHRLDGMRAHWHAWCDLLTGAVVERPYCRQREAVVFGGTLLLHRGGGRRKRSSAAYSGPTT